MGCWNITLYDNDECVDFLIEIFSLLGIRKVEADRSFTVGVLKIPGMSIPLIARHQPDEVEEIRKTFEALTAKDIQEGKARNPNLKKELFDSCHDLALGEMGLTLENMWTLVQMHVGLPLEDTAQADMLAKAFDTRECGGTFKIHDYLCNFTGATKMDLENTRNFLTPSMKKGVEDYKKLMVENKPLKPMKLAFFGIGISFYMWISGMLPDFQNQLAANMWEGTPHIQTM